MSLNHDELKQQIEMVCIERGLEPDEVMKAVEQAIASAYRKEVGDKDKNYEAEFNYTTAKYSIYEVTSIVDEVLSPTREIDIVEARLYNPAAEVGDKIRKEEVIDNEINFGRIASQVARQVMFQSINSIRHSKVLQKFKDRVGDVVNVEVDYFKKGGYIVKLGQTTGFLGKENLLPIDRFKAGQVIKALIVDIVEDNRGNSRVVLTRTTPEFVKAIIKNEIPEVDSGIVNIDKIVREPGSRTKLLVSASDDESVDPVGTILGKKNIRIINIMREISPSMQEKIDVIENNPEDLELMIMDSLEPAEIDRVEILAGERKANIYCYPEEAALAVGRGGVNIRLAGELLEYELNIVTIDGEQATGGPEIIADDEYGDN
ncbi:MAG: transcription termination factor NusA [bacterium]